jgi:hypothetical protein
MRFVLLLSVVALCACHADSTAPNLPGEPPEGGPDGSAPGTDSQPPDSAAEGSDAPNADVADADAADADGSANAQCPPRIPSAGPCESSLTCMYGVDGALLPERPPCAYADVDCAGGQWVFSHNDPGTSQCGFSFDFDGNYADECTPVGGTCIDPHLHDCPTGFTAARSVLALAPAPACGPSPNAYCCLPNTPSQALGQSCFNEMQCQSGNCWGSAFAAAGLRSPTGVCTQRCTSAAECGAGFSCVGRPSCTAVDGGSCGDCLAICGDGGACGVGSCQARTTVEGTSVAACDPCVPPADGGSGDAAAPTCTLAGSP